MQRTNSTDWKTYKEKEIENLVTILDSLGYKLEDEQPHTMGERFLMHAVTTTSGMKLILIGSDKSDKSKVVIKATRDADGKQELLDARKAKDILNAIDFASHTFLSPKELYYGENDGYLISIYEFIEQDLPFIDRPIEEQFYLSLSSFKAQEGAHAATYGHIKTIEKTFPIYHSTEYLAHFAKFAETIKKETSGGEISDTLAQAHDFLLKNSETIDQYCGFLVHTDFVPHNIRVKDGKVFLLDHSSIRFGNKYEGWARFLNFMALYNPELERHLTEYVQNNRTHEEHLALQLMRVYRLTELICYYTGAVLRSNGALKELNQKRILFWTEVLKAQLQGEYVSEEITKAYKKDRELLRSPDEKKRQIGLH